MREVLVWGDVFDFLLLGLILALSLTGTAYASENDVWDDIQALIDAERASFGVFMDDTAEDWTRSAAFFASLSDEVEAIVTAREDYVPGSLRRRGDQILWRSQRGIAIQNSNEGLTVDVYGDVTLSPPFLFDLPTIQTSADMTITGGKLTVVGAQRSAAILAMGSPTLTIEYADLDVEGRQYGIRGSGSAGASHLVMRCSVLHVMNSGSFSAICDFSGSIELQGCEVSVPADATVGSGQIGERGGSAAHEIEIFARPNLHIFEGPYGVLNFTVTYMPDTGKDVTWMIAAYGRDGRMLDTYAQTVKSYAGRTVQWTQGMVENAAVYRMFLLDENGLPAVNCAEYIVP